MIRDNNVTPRSLLVSGYLSAYTFSGWFLFWTWSKVNNVLSKTQKNQAEDPFIQKKYQRGVLKAVKIMLLLQLSMLNQLVPSYLL